AYQQQFSQHQQPPPQQVPQRRHVRGRVMALTREQAEESNLVIGTLPILGRAASVLVDLGASLCFASEEFYESLVRHSPERQCDVMVDLPSVYRQVLEAQQTDSELVDILQMPDVELDEDSEVRFDRFWCCTGGGCHDMVTMPRVVATCSLSLQVDPSRLGAHRLKTEADTPFPPLSLSFPSFLLLLPPLSSLFTGGFSVSLRCSWWEVIPHLCRRCDRGAWSEEEVRLLSSGRAHAGRRRLDLYVTLGVCP
ncbi:hypothetical protein Taro_046459, partial [Colocasia esculenta]|nr:hypothetical protein [Colocasia esculenta]